MMATVFLYPSLLPRWITQDHVEPGTLSKEDFWKSYREVKWFKLSERLQGLLVLLRAHDLIFDALPLSYIYRE